MIVDRLVIHHTYDGPSAFDVSMNHHHGSLEHVVTGGGRVNFTGGPGCVRVAASERLDRMRAVRTTVRFKVPVTPWGIDPWFGGQGPRRMNLIEGYLSFALVISADRALHGTIVDHSGQWRGTSSAAGVVGFGGWHEATFVHDGFSACRIDLDGVTVAEDFDVVGPVSPPARPYGVAIGHWPDPDDRYSFIGDIDDVKVWIDRPEAARDLAEECCVNGEELDELFTRLRGEAFDDPSFDPAAYDAAAKAMLDLGSKTFGTIASGTEADRLHAWDLTRRFVISLGTGDRDTFVNTIAEGVQIAAAKSPPGTLEADSAALMDAVRPTLLGPLADAVAAGAKLEEVQRIAAKLGIDRWLDAFCFGDLVPEPPKRPPKGEGRPPKGEGRPPKGDKDDRADGEEQYRPSSVPHHDEPRYHENDKDHDGIPDDAEDDDPGGPR